MLCKSKEVGKKVTSYENHDPEHELIWRPFQLAFVLMTLASSSERSHEERKFLI